MQNIHILLKSGAVEHGDVLNAIGAPHHGAQSFFFGSVRNHNQGQPVIKMCYEIFEPLAEAILRNICEEVIQLWGDDLKICIVHAKGELPVGDLSVGIGVSSKHRDAALSACRYIMEAIKHQVPIWKQEHYPHGSTGWVKGHALCHHE